MKTNRSTAKNCRLDVIFPHTKEGRPTIYDFLWEDAGPLFTSLNEKSVHVRAPAFSTTKKNTPYYDSFSQKLARDKRFNVRSSSPSQNEVDAVIPSQQLDHFLNAYNILFDAHFSGLQLESDSTRVDFSRAGEHTIRIETTNEKAEHIKSFFSRTTNAPRVRMFRFGISNPLHHALEKGR